MGNDICCCTQGVTGVTGDDGQFSTVATTPPAAPEAGDAWYDSASGNVYIYYDGYWVEAASANDGPTGNTGATGATGSTGATGDAGSATIYRWTKTAAGGETSLSGNDNNAVSLVYTVGQELVFINGVLQVRGTDYVASTGTTITGLTALAASDIVDIWAPDTFNVSNAILSTVATTKGDIFVATAGSTVTRLGVGTNGQYLQADSAETPGIKWATVAGYSAPTLGSTSIASGATVTTISGMTDIVLNGAGSIQDELTLLLMGAL